jgi:hypothetical protein
MRNGSLASLRKPINVKSQIDTPARRVKPCLPLPIAADQKCGGPRPPAPRRTRRRLLGLYEGTPVPSEQDFTAVRRPLRGLLASRGRDVVRWE